MSDTGTQGNCGDSWLNGTEISPRHGLPDDDWDPQQQALADAVLHINHADEGTNLA